MASNKWNAKRRKRKAEVVSQCTGVMCLFCGYGKRLIAHRKDGSAHKRFESMGEKEHRIEMESGAYVRLCFKCHKAVHWCMNHLGLDWNQIVELWGRSASGNTTGLQPVIGSSTLPVSTIN
jgi:hypothetical protein